MQTSNQFFEGCIAYGNLYPWPCVKQEYTATQYELWFGKNPSLDHLRPWGPTTYVHTPTRKQGKPSPRATKMVFIRYPTEYKGYVMYGEHPNCGITKIDSYSVDFLEDEFPTISKIKKDVELFEL